MPGKDLKKMPLFTKAMNILDIVDRMVDLIPQENEQLLDTGRMMQASALQIPPKIAGAAGSGLFDLKMESAAIIRKCAREIQVFSNAFKGEEFTESEYVMLLRSEIDEFRQLFAEWVKTFDQWDYVIDRWGLFNPPGVNYDDQDPDDDIPFDNPFTDPEE